MNVDDSTRLTRRVASSQLLLRCLRAWYCSHDALDALLDSAGGGSPAFSGGGSSEPGTVGTSPFEMGGVPGADADSYARET